MNREWLICVNGEGKQEKVMYPGRYKCFDTFAPMGPLAGDGGRAAH